MRAGPLRQTTGAVGLVALAPTAGLLLTGALSPRDAAIRATVTFVAVLALGRVAGWWVNMAATAVERGAPRPESEPVEADVREDAELREPVA